MDTNVVFNPPPHNTTPMTSSHAHGDRIAAVALIVGIAAGFITMLLHPTGHDVITEAAAGRANSLVAGVHLLALFGQPLLLTGLLAFTLRLGQRRDLAVGAFIFYLLGSMAVMIAAAASGLISPAAVRGIGAATVDQAARMREFMRFAGMINQSFTRIFVAFAGAAIVLWSLAGTAERSLSRVVTAFGMVLGAAMMVAGLTGWLRLDIHGFGAVVLGQGVWLGGVAAFLWRGRGSTESSPGE